MHYITSTAQHAQHVRLPQSAPDGGRRHLAGLLYNTCGANQQPRPHATYDTTTQLPVSETLQGVAGAGGPRAQGDDGENPYEDL